MPVYDHHGKEQLIRADELDDVDIFRKAHDLADAERLRDLTKEVPLFPRAGSKSSDGTPLRRAHFATRDGVEPSLQFVDVGERNPEHDQHIKDLGLRLAIGDWTWKRPDGRDLRLTGCTWRLEAYRTWRGESVAHDLVGVRESLHISASSPSIAIEVINAHYPEERAMELYLAASKSLPLLVFFECVNRGNLFLKVHDASREITCRFYVYQGSLWNFEEKCAFCTSSELRKAMEKLRKAGGRR